MAVLVPFIPLIAAGIGAASTGVAIAKQPQAPQAPATSEIDSAKTEAEAAQAQAAALRKRRGMASTILTSPMGASGGQTQKSTLGA